MKSKILVALLLALVMLFSIAVPALAGAPSKGGMARYGDNEPSGWGKYALQATHDNDLKITVVIRGATANKTYEMLLWQTSSPSETPYPDGGSYVVATVTTDGRGNLRYSEKFGDTFGAGTEYFQIQLLQSPYDADDDICFLGTKATVAFKP